MSARPDAAIHVPIGDINEAFLGYKVRTAGIILEYDALTSLVVLSSDRSTIKLNVQSIVMEATHGTQDPSVLLRPGSKISAIGTLIAGAAESPYIVSCIRIFDAHSLDLAQWQEAARRISQAMHGRHTSER